MLTPTPPISHYLRIPYLGVLGLLLSAQSLANLDAAVTANPDNQQNLQNLVNSIQTLQQNQSVDGNLGALLTHFEQLGQPQLINRALQALLPEVTRQQTLRQNTRYHRRQHQFSHSQPPPVLPATAFASLSNLQWLSADNTANTAAESTTDVWLQAWFDDADQDNTDGFDGVDVNGQGVSAGFDLHLTPRLTVGLHAGEYHADLDSNQFGDDNSRNRSWGASLFYSREQKLSATPALHQWSISYSRSRYEIDRRRLMLVIVDERLRRLQLESDIDADEHSIATGYAINLTRRGLNLQPFINLQYSRSSTDDYVENGGGNLNLFVANADEEQLSGTLGASLTWEYYAGSWLISPGVTLAFEHDFQADPSLSVARFRGSDASFTTRGYAVEENRWRYSVSMGFFHTRNLGISLAYQGQHSDGYQYQGVTLNLQARL